MTVTMLLLGLTLQGQTPVAAGSVVLMKMESKSGVSTDTAGLLNSLMAEQLKEAGVFSSVSSFQDLQNLITVDQQRQLMDCGVSSCMAEIGGAMGAEYVVTSSVGKLASTWVLSASLLNTRTARTLGAVNEQVDGDEAALPPLIPTLVAKLLGQAGMRPKEANANAAHPSATPVATEKAPALPTKKATPPQREPPSSEGGAPRVSSMVVISALGAAGLAALGAVVAVGALVLFNGSVVGVVVVSTKGVPSPAVAIAFVDVLLLGVALFPAGVLGFVVGGIAAAALTVAALLGRGAEGVVETVTEKGKDK